MLHVFVDDFPIVAAGIIFLAGLWNFVDWAGWKWAVWKNAKRDRWRGFEAISGHAGDSTKRL